MHLHEYFGGAHIRRKQQKNVQTKTKTEKEVSALQLQQCVSTNFSQIEICKHSLTPVAPPRPPQRTDRSESIFRTGILGLLLGQAWPLIWLMNIRNARRLFFVHIENESHNKGRVKKDMECTGINMWVIFLDLYEKPK